MLSAEDILRVIDRRQGHSLAERLCLIPREERQALLATLPARVLRRLTWDWRGFWARPGQLWPETDWQIWLIQAGRGFGKTRAGAEAVQERVEQGLWRHVALVGRTSADTRETMVEGESGLLNIAPPWFRPVYEPMRARVVWPNGAIGKMYSAAEPEATRGPNHDGGWADELAAWRFRKAWDNLLHAVRVGDDPRIIATTTPRPVPVIRELLEDPTTVVTRGTTYDNIGNLSPQYIRRVVRRHEGTTLGRQELLGELLMEVPGALWNQALLDRTRATAFPGLRRIVVAIDPPTEAEEGAAEAGIVVAGISGEGDGMQGWVLEDLSLLASPAEWAGQGVAAYHRLQADRIVAEKNQGGDMVRFTLQTVDASVPVKLVTASRGKLTRAEPVAALYEQNRVHHVGYFPEMEDQMRTWVPGERSPDRMDALVWAITELFALDKEEKVFGRDFGIA